MFSKSYRHYVLGTLTFVYTLSALDMSLMILLLEPIKKELDASDAQLGFLTGIAFGLFYAVLGLPVARWVDRGNRATITSIAVGLWGVTVMSCLFVGSFVQLALARVAASVGESGCMPPTYSLVGDYFPAAAERTRAMTIYMLANPLSPLVSFTVGGWLNEHYGWRTAFFVIGVPGLLVAVLVKLTIVEPRGIGRQALATGDTPLRLRAVLTTLWHQPSSRHLGLAVVLVFTMGLSLSPWFGAFMIRSHGMNTADLGLWFGLIFGVGGVCGTLLGGLAANRWFADDERGQMRLCSVVIATLAPCIVVLLLAPAKSTALCALTLWMVAFNFLLGPGFALLQRLVIDEMRASAMAIVTLFSYLIGMGVGPQAVGMLSDALRPALKSDSLRYAMLTTSVLAVWSAYHLWQAGRSVKVDLARVQRDQADIRTSAPDRLYSNVVPSSNRMET
jgi:MFS family permease